MSPIRWCVVLTDRSVSGSAASGRLPPAPRWSNSTIRYAAGSNSSRHHGGQPEPGPPCSATAARPSGLPDTSQRIRWPSPTSSMPPSWGSSGGYDISVRSPIAHRPWTSSQLEQRVWRDRPPLARHPPRARRGAQPGVGVAVPAPAQLRPSLADPERRNALVAAPRSRHREAPVARDRLGLLQDERDALVERQPGAARGDDSAQGVLGPAAAA